MIRRLLRAFLGAAAACLVVAPFAVSWHLAENRHRFAERHAAPAADIPERRLERWRSLGTGLPDRAAPVLLAYHDVAPESDSRYTVDSELLDAHLTALRAAGYRTLTGPEFAAYVAGGPVPPRSVLLTFDDGTGGLWRYADRVLQRHDAHGSVFLITGRVGDHRPYYLTWDEISRMADSGRWDFQSHSHDLHTRERATTPMRTEDGGRETDGQLQRRVRADLTRSAAEFDRRGLPAPELFSYPFSGTHEAAAPVVAELFTAAFSNTTPSPAPAGRRAAAGGEFERYEVFDDTTADTLLREVVRRTPRPPGGDLLADPGAWRTGGGDPPDRDETPFHAADRPRRGTYQQATHAPYATADWADYSVCARFAAPAEGATLRVAARAGGAASVEVRVSNGRAALFVAGRETAEAELDPRDTRGLALTVDGDRATALVDGETRLTATVPRGPEAAGGVAVVVSRPDEDAPWPLLRALTVCRPEGDGGPDPAGE